MLKNSHSILACCPTMNIKIAGDAFKLGTAAAMNGIYQMQSGLSNGQRYWISSEGNAIWIRDTGNQWNIGTSKRLGSSSAGLYVPINDPSKECPHDNLQSNWRYVGGKGLVEDLSNSIRIHCVKGNRKNEPVINCNYQTFCFLFRFWRNSIHAK